MHYPYTAVSYTPTNLNRGGAKIKMMGGTCAYLQNLNNSFNHVDVAIDFSIPLTANQALTSTDNPINKRRQLDTKVMGNTASSSLLYMGSATERPAKTPHIPT